MSASHNLLIKGTKTAYAAGDAFGTRYLRSAGLLALVLLAYPCTYALAHGHGGAYALGAEGAAAAYGASIGESTFYYIVIVAKDVRAAGRSARDAGRTLTWSDIGRTAARLLAEFGPAELLDVFLIRPAAMAAGIHLLGPRLGVVAGQIAANVSFYVPVIFVYEWRRRRERATIVRS